MKRCQKIAFDLREITDCLGPGNAGGSPAVTGGMEFNCGTPLEGTGKAGITLHCQVGLGRTPFFFVHASSHGKLWAVHSKLYDSRWVRSFFRRQITATFCKNKLIIHGTFAKRYEIAKCDVEAVQKRATLLDLDKI